MLVIIIIKFICIYHIDVFLKGTSKPTKYHVIWDDNNFTEDELQEITFNMCFMYARSTHSVSYPIPIYYAHLAACRALTYTKKLVIFNLVFNYNVALNYLHFFYSKQINVNNLDEEQKKIKLNSSLNDNSPMFFI